MHWDPDVTHNCDLVAMTCTCGDFSVYREVFEPSDSLRTCKHLRMLLAEAGQVTLSEPAAMPLWEERGGRVFRWTAPNGRLVFLSVDPTREWINVAPIKRGGAEDEVRFGWSVEENRWAYGDSPKGLARALKPVLQSLAQLSAGHLFSLGPSVARRWAANRVVYDAREAAEAVEREKRAVEALEAARVVGLCCGVCAVPLGHPWGSPVGTELPCSSCGFPNLVVDAERADASERALIDWKYYDDPRPGGGKRVFSAEKERRERELAALEARIETHAISLEEIQGERDRIENEFSARFNDLHQHRHAELADVRRRIRNAQGRLKRRAERAAGDAGGTLRDQP